jgi:hypothetical protein
MFLFRSVRAMGTIKLRRLEDLVKWEADLRVECRECGRQARFSAANMVSWFQSRRWSTSLDSAPQHFRCAGIDGSGCGSRNVRLSAMMPDAVLPPERPRPAATSAPYGLDPEAWAKADDRERKRMLAQLR